MSVPVRIRGVVYASIAAAARAFGVCRKTICWHLDTYGHGDFVGMGCKSPGKFIPVAPKRPVTIHGLHFPSIRSAATALGLKESALHQRLRRPMTARISDDLLARAMRYRASTERLAA